MNKNRYFSIAVIKNSAYTEIYPVKTIRLNKEEVYEDIDRRR